MLELVISAVCGLSIGGGCVWFYYRDKFTEVLTELEDKKLIIKTIHDHSDAIERTNVKRMVKDHNAKMTKKVKTEKKISEKPIKKYKKQSV